MSVPVSEIPSDPSLFKVIRGRPTPEELAALAALLGALTAPVATGAVADPRAHGPVPAAWGRRESFPPMSWMARR
ncbi:acyl-CoA carboxylase epsilon subunit [Streptomyces sp. NPDC003023]|uniref:acyl-CoA carboxylase epsilon subunit n=1 Tax=Streptomyces sp. NPDC003023 TaxID=3364675 RepID=UPI003698F67C